MLRWTANDLGKRAGVSLPTVQRMEKQGGVDSSLGKSLNAVLHSLEAAGIEFLPDNGVRLRPPLHRKEAMAKPEKT